MSKATNIVATVLEGERKDESARKTPGAFWYLDYQNDQDVGIVHSCPCGCGLLSGINLKPYAGRLKPMWTNSGTREKPTLSPSVGIHAWEPNSEYPRRAEKEADGYHWHGYLKDGVWISV